ncbi:MAG TPA: hypothetical protein VFO85_11570 [Vicinamibacteria bacterium]|nr:hypothetical protein [Vicinamibacteria bacterium]
MAYEPTNTRRDGRFRSIEVKLPRRPGLTLRTRKGYLAPDSGRRVAASGTPAVPAPPAAAPAPAPAPRGLDAAEARALLEAPPAPSAGPLPVLMTADWFDMPPGGPRAVIRAHVDLAALARRPREARGPVTLEIVGGLYDAEGKAVGVPFGKRADLDLRADQVERLARSGLQYQELLPLRPGRYQVKLVALERGGGAVGSAAQWLEVPDLGAGSLAVSSLFLSASAAPGGAAAPAGTSTEEEALRDAHTLRRFRTDQSLYFQLYVYNPTRDASGSADVVLQAQVRAGGKLVAASKPQPAALQAKDGVPVPETNGIPLQGLAPGTYELRVVVVDRKARVNASRAVDFTVQ